ncbi:related to putative protein [Cephalotrichum gorgonifer]|uniref:F-box domain-containing protein n=1 Tax=Cephalotrichum gorgonifer TaxID=2041049 RepID=A0AAE8MS57_9PEZI|nr:related to putative protein [Cephalotrichum gorgonifer]
MAVSLSLLPMELQFSIIRHLDPIGLISLSQTSSHFRLVVSPKKKDFAERLLQLELLPEQGGPTPTFRSRDNYISPGPLDPEWNDILWACTSCLRLLPHLYFDNNSILRLGYRKPSPLIFDPRHAVTTWEPAGHRVSRRPKKGKTGDDALREDKKQRLRYSICVTRGRGTAHRAQPPLSNSLSTLLASGMAGISQTTQAEFDALTPEEKLRIYDDNAEVIERERCGNKRHLRKCNECRYQHGDLRPHLNGRGRRLKTSKMPILPSRRTVTFGMHLDRWFPGFSDALENRRPGYNALLYQAIYREGARDRPMALYMARCPGCECWQELRNLRIGGDFLHWKPNVATGYSRSETTPEEWSRSEASLDESRCNACFAAENGREALAEALWLWFERLSSFELKLLEWRILSSPAFMTRIHHGYNGAPREYMKRLKWILDHMPTLQQTFSMMPMLSYYDIATIRLRQTQWRELWEETKLKGDRSWTTCDMDKCYEEWVSNLDEAEEHWRWLMACTGEVRERPMALVEWALGEDSGKSVEV